MRLRERGAPICIVYLGHRDGTALMVHKDSGINTIRDLKGKTIAIPSRYSNQYLILFKAMQDRNLSIDDLKAVEMPPPDMPAALASHSSVDAIIAGEPIMARTQLPDAKGTPGFGKLLFITNQVWPEFISCVLAVREDAAVRLADRVVVLTARPARIAEVVPIELPRPRRATWTHATASFRRWAIWPSCVAAEQKKTQRASLAVGTARARMPAQGAWPQAGECTETGAVPGNRGSVGTPTPATWLTRPCPSAGPALAGRSEARRSRE